MEDIQQVDYRAEAEKILTELFRADMDDDEWKEFKAELLQACGLSIDALAKDLETGVHNGYSLEKQKNTIIHIKASFGK